MHNKGNRDILWDDNDINRTLVMIACLFRIAEHATTIRGRVRSSGKERRSDNSCKAGPE